MTTKTPILLACLFAASTLGCQSWRTKTAGEQIVEDRPVAANPAETATGATPANPLPPTTPPPPVVVAPVAPTTPTTTTATTAPLVAPLYVAADADEATRLRNWPVSTNLYPSGSFVAGPVYRVTVPPPKTNHPADIATQDLFQTATVPVTMLATPLWWFVTPPLTPIEYHGEQFPPSYTVDDPKPYYTNEKVPGQVQMQR